MAARVGASASTRAAELEREWRERVLAQLDEIKTIASGSATAVQVLASKVEGLDARVTALEQTLKGQQEQEQTARQQMDLKLWGLLFAVVGVCLQFVKDFATFAMAHWH